MGQGCLSKGGVPVQPFHVLGGFDDLEGYHSKLQAFNFTGLSVLIGVGGLGQACFPPIFSSPTNKFPGFSSLVKKKNPCIED